MMTEAEVAKVLNEACDLVLWSMQTGNPQRPEMLDLRKVTEICRDWFRLFEENQKLKEKFKANKFNADKFWDGWCALRNEHQQEFEDKVEKLIMEALEVE